MTAKREPVDYRYDAINPLFLKCLARIGAYGAEKYGSFDNYKESRLTGDKSPINHIYEHLRAYREEEPYERFDGHTRWHLVAIAYNAMMEFFYQEDKAAPSVLSTTKSDQHAASRKWVYESITKLNGCCVRCTHPVADTHYYHESADENYIACKANGCTCQISIDVRPY